MAAFTLNGKPAQLDGPDAMPLLWALRDLAGLTGTKYGCGMGLCGAYTVHLDGAAVRACVTPLSAVAGRRVTTIEGVAASDAGQRVQRAWLQADVPQCGYCQPGQIMTAAALLAANARPDDTQIAEAMQGNICRCGTYPRIKRAIKSASGQA